jgi:hypothetical protein
VRSERRDSYRAARGFEGAAAEPCQEASSYNQVEIGRADNQSTAMKAIDSKCEIGQRKYLWCVKWVPRRFRLACCLPFFMR